MKKLWNKMMRGLYDWSMQMMSGSHALWILCGIASPVFENHSEVCNFFLYIWNDKESMRCLIAFRFFLFALSNKRSRSFMGSFYVFHPNAGVVNRVQFFHKASEINSGVAEVINRQFLSVVLEFCVNNHYIHVMLTCFLCTKTHDTLLFSSL